MAILNYPLGRLGEVKVAKAEGDGITLCKHQ